MNKELWITGLGREKRKGHKLRNIVSTKWSCQVERQEIEYLKPKREGKTGKEGKEGVEKGAERQRKKKSARGTGDAKGAGRADF